MKIKVLTEDTSCSTVFRNEHGFSLYIETNDKKVLFDTGASDLFLENAEKLGVDIEDVDYAVISHGHYDHGGGLSAFLRKNQKAMVFVNQEAFGRHYSKRNEKLTDIGLNQELMNSERIVLINEIFQISEGLLLFSRVAGNDFISSCNQSLFAVKDGIISPDRFEHEQNLIITEGTKTVLIAGCAHRGIANILKSAVYLTYKQPEYVLGGFHLYNYGARISEDPAIVVQIGEFLKETGSMFYTGHCTGPDAYRILKQVMGDKIAYLSAGSEIEI